MAAPVGVTSSDGDPVVVDREPSQQLGGRGRGNREPAVGRLHGAAAERERRDVHPVHAKRLEAGHRSHHVDESIERAHLVEVHRVDRDAVDARLGLGQPLEHGAARAP